jgi:hypothetical protein
MPSSGRRAVHSKIVTSWWGSYPGICSGCECELKGSSGMPVAVSRKCPSQRSCRCAGGSCASTWLQIPRWIRGSKASQGCCPGCLGVPEAIRQQRIGSYPGAA